MQHPASFFLLIFVISSSLLLAVSWPMMNGRVKPNSLYGVRTPKTLADESVWYKANAYGGRLLFYEAILQLAVALVLFSIPALRANFGLYAIICGVVTWVGVLTVAGVTLRYVERL